MIINNKLQEFKNKKLYIFINFSKKKIKKMKNSIKKMKKLN